MVPSKSLKFRALQRNINSTAHITYQLVGGSMFLPGGYRLFVQIGQSFLVEPVRMSESFSDAIITFSHCGFWPLFNLCGTASALSWERSCCLVRVGELVLTGRRQAALHSGA